MMGTWNRLRVALLAALIGVIGLLPQPAAAYDRILSYAHDCAAACEPDAAEDPAALQAAALLPQYAADLQAAAWDRYELRLTLDPARQRISGAVRIFHTNRSNQSYQTIYLRAYPNHPDVRGALQITAAYVDGRPVTRTLADNAILIGLPLDAPLAPGATAQIDIGFITVTPLNDSRGAFGAFNLEAGVWALGTFYPILARYDDSGWDTHVVNSLGDFAVSSTALYDVTIDAPADWQLVATGSPLGEAQIYGTRQTWRFVSGPQREFFLAGLQGLTELSTEVDGTLVQSFVQPGRPEAAQRSLQVAADALQIFNRRFGPYPFRRLIVIEAALTNFYGMEYPGVVLIDSGLYRRNNQRFETTVAHEVAHQWWFGLVGNDAQREAWLDEGWASFSEVIYYREREDPAQAEQQLAEFRSSWQALRDSGRDAPLSAPLTELEGRYVAVVYSKAALFLAALEQQIGTEAFDRFVRAYVAQARYRDVTASVLIAAAEQACSCTLTDFARPWLTGTP